MGVPLFQDQLLRMAMEVANFSGAEADELRRAVGMRRSWERMKNLEEKLRAGMAANGIDSATEDEIYRTVVHLLCTSALNRTPQVVRSLPMRQLIVK
jgi:error-prone DNA polymerase